MSVVIMCHVYETDQTVRSLDSACHTCTSALGFLISDVRIFANFHNKIMYRHCIKEHFFQFFIEVM